MHGTSNVRTKKKIEMKIKEIIFNWLFKEQLEKLKISEQKCSELLEEQYTVHNQTLRIENRLRNITDSFEVGVDVSINNRYDPSWAVICIKGQKHDYIRFKRMDEGGLRAVSQFLRQFESNRITIDMPPMMEKGQFLQL